MASKRIYTPLSKAHHRTTDRAWLALLLCAMLVYLFGLGSANAPTNGDEMVYLHIARLTAESGNWLPLVSDLNHMRNTKPPLLFWQAMVAGDWGNCWNLFLLRLPSVVYTFLTTGAIVLLTQRISTRWRTAYVAGVVYLLFFSTFRYGRVYLTSAPETFWLALPVFYLLYRYSASSTVALVSRATKGSAVGWLAYLLFGLCIGLGCAYKSFALAVPACATLWCMVLFADPTAVRWSKLWRTSFGVGMSGLLAVGLFSLWFVLDPDPQAVWREFVLGENIGKMSSTQSSYWQAAWNGDYPIGKQLLAYVVNAAPLCFVVLGLAWLGLRYLLGGRRGSGGSTSVMSFSSARSVSSTPLACIRLLMIWLAVWLLIFTIPSQRSERYVIPAMPALAMLCALYWERISKFWFYVSSLVLLPCLVFVGRIAWAVDGLGSSSADPVSGFVSHVVPHLALAGALAVVAIGILAMVLSLLRPAWSRTASLIATLALYAGFNFTVQPLDGAQANYSASVQAAMSGKRVAVSSNFNAQYERFQFVLPGAQLFPYDAPGSNTGVGYPDLPPAQRLERLLSEFNAVAWLQEYASEAAPCLPQCHVIAQRWHIKSRHKSGEVTWHNVWYPEQWLFTREWLISAVPQSASSSQN